MIKTTGLEFKRFYDDPDELELYINDVHWVGDSDLETVGDSYKIKIGSGIILYGDGSDADFCKVFRGWIKKQTTVILMVECPKEKAQFLESGIKELGGMII